MRAPAEFRALSVAQPRRDGAPKPKAWRRIVQGDADAAHARHGIRLRRDLANLAFDLNGGKQLQADRERQAELQRRPGNPGPTSTTASLTSGRATVTTVCPGETTCPDIGANRGDDAGEIGLELRIAQLLECLGQVGLRASD